MSDDSFDGGSSIEERPPPNVLLIEDDVTSAARLRQLLSEDGYRVEWLTNGRDVIDRIANGPRPDVILMDYKLPHEDGVVLARKARAQWGDVPVVFVTSYNEVVSREPPLDPPAVLLSKPVAYDELVAALEAALVRTA